MRSFTQLEEKILNRIQKDIKISESPFLELMEELKIERDKFLTTLQGLRDEGIIRIICGIFNAGKIGYQSTLVAFEVLDRDIDHASKIITEHSGVSHNYLRGHRYNIWFTITIKRGLSLENTISELAEKSRAKDSLILKNEKLFKIGLMLEVGHGDDERRTNFDDPACHNIETDSSYREITEEEKNAVKLLQIDLPGVMRPFQWLIERENIDISEKRLIDIGESLKKEGILRRYSAVLKHQKAGFTSNAMTAWKFHNITNESDIISIFRSIPNISHLYLRTIYPGRWEYPLFAMIHAKNSKELTNIIKGLEEKTGINDYQILYSLKEFKKSRVQYFLD